MYYVICVVQFMIMLLYIVYYDLLIKFPMVAIDLPMICVFYDFIDFYNRFDWFSNGCLCVSGIFVFNDILLLSFLRL